MTDFALDPATGDLPAGQGLSLVTGVAAVRQALDIRLQFFQGEWFLNEAAGVPYFQDVFTKQPRGLASVDALFKETILATPNVRSIKAFASTFNFATRQYAMTFTVDTPFGPVDMTWPG